MKTDNYLVLTQYRQKSTYNDFIGKFYHFPGGSKKSYLKFFEKLPIEFIYYEPEKDGKGEYFGTGRITNSPFKDKREEDNYFVEISDYKPFSKPVYFKDKNDNVLEKIYSPNYYNAQNAVRKTTAKFIEEISLDGGVNLNFNADAHLIKVLGEQLIATERVGILELVKNAYDANATECTVRFEKIPSLPDKLDEYKFLNYDGPVIIVTDNGSGMSRDVIENGWLRPASTLKTSIKEAIREQKKEAIAKGKIGTFNRWLNEYKKANKGRLPLGEKGVGRFACHRLGKNLIIKTKTSDIDYEHVLKINWDDFDYAKGKIKDLSSVAVSLTRENPSWDYGAQNSGTQIIIYGGRDGFELNKEIVDEINESVIRLNAPELNTIKKRKEKNVNKTTFNAKVECPQIGELVTESIYDLSDPVFTLDGIVDENGVLNYDFSFKPPHSNLIPLNQEEIAKDEFFDLRKTISENNPFSLGIGKYRKPECGEFYIHLDLWYRVSPWVQTENVRKVRELLDQYGGISIYRDSLNLFPAEWGAEMDWLRLSKRHIKKGQNISYYSMLGYVELDQGKNIDLVDKTDRQGLIENTAFNDLSELVAAIVFRTELDYKKKRETLADIRKSIIKRPEEISHVSSDTSALIENIINNYNVVKDPADIFASISSMSSSKERQEKLIDLRRSLKELEESVKQLQQVEESLIEEAGFGKAVAFSIHELAKTTTNLYNGIVQIVKSKKINLQELNELKDSAGSLRSELKNLSPLRTIRNEERKEFEIKKSIEFVSGVFKRKFKSSNIDFSFNKEESFPLYARYGVINQILSNLIDNSVYWLNTLEKNEADFDNKMIRIQLNEKNRTLQIADNGPGIHRAIMPYLFQSGASMRIPPSGLGLYICRYYMYSLHGEIYLSTKNEMLASYKGAQFTLDFSRSPRIKEEYK